MDSKNDAIDGSRACGCYAGLAAKLRDGNRVADVKSRRQMRMAADAIEELVEFVKDADCKCFDEYGTKLRYSDLEGVPCDCDRCELVKRHSA